MTGRPPGRVPIGLVWAVRLASLLVPARQRGTWRDDWEAELHSAGDRGGPARPLPRGIVFGLLRDAWATRRYARAIARARGQPDDDRPRHAPALAGLLGELMRAGRALAARPAYTTLVVVTIGVGVGSATAMFSAVHHVLLTELPYADDERVVVLRQVDTRDGSVADGVSAANALDVAEATRTFSHVAAANSYGFTLLSDVGALSLRGWVVSEGFFEAIGARLALGRPFTADEYRSGAPVVVLGHATWAARFASDPDVVGRELVLDGRAHTVVGVLGARFAYPSASEVWAPRPPQPWDEDLRGSASFEAVARLAPEVTDAQARSDLDRIAEALSARHPVSNAGVGFEIVPLRTDLLGDAGTQLLLLFGAVALLLAAASVNVAGLQLARGVERSRELAVRGALGAGAGRLLRLVGLESVALGALGALVGVVVASLGIDAFRVLAPTGLPRVDQIRLDGAALAFSAFAAFSSALASGVAPAVRALRSDPGRALREGGRSSSARGAVALRDRLVTLQIAVALVLAVGAGLMTRSLGRALDREIGFDAGRLLAVQLFAYDEQDRPDRDFTRRATEELSALPGVESVGLTTSVPLADDALFWSGLGTASFTVEGGPTVAAGTEPVVRLSTIGPRYPAAMGIAVVAGRPFADSDALDAPSVVLVNEAFARRYLAAAEPVGSRVDLLGAFGRTSEVVGVLADVRAGGPESEPRPELYLPLGQAPTGSLTYVIRTSGDPGSLSGPVREALRTVDPGQPIWALSPVSDLLGERTRGRRFNTLLMGSFAAIALLLSAIGVVGLTSFSVEQRVGELGLRRALGGDPVSVATLVLGRVGRLAATGVALGLAASLGLTRLMRGLLFGVDPVDPLTYATVSVLVAVVGFAAAVPAIRRALKIDPRVALSSE